MHARVGATAFVAADCTNEIFPGRLVSSGETVAAENIPFHVAAYGDIVAMMAMPSLFTARRRHREIVSGWAVKKLSSVTIA